MTRIAQNLNGVWDFAYLGDNSPQPSIQFNNAMTVPGCFDCMGDLHGQRGTAVLRRFVHAGGMQLLKIDGLGLAAKICWDGQEIGVCPYAYMPEEFVFDAGKEGWHELRIILDNRHNQVFFPFYDFYGYGGVYGDVTLEKLPEGQPFIKRVHVSTRDFQRRLIRIEVEFSAPVTEEIRLVFNRSQEFTFAAAGEKWCHEMELPGYELWSHDSPNLHSLEVYCGEDCLATNFGIRQIQTAGRDILLNGEKLFLAGCNRHESHPELGAATPPALMLSDLLAMKNAGMNFVRGSHYPQRRHFLDICDRIGMLVWEETLGWDVKPPVLHSEEFLANQLEQTARLAASSYNHPSIIIRGFLNETESQLEETRPVIAALVEATRKADDTRLITYASNKYEKDVCTDLVDIVAMNPYPGWFDANWETIRDIQNIRPRLKALADAMPADRPLIISEIGAGATYGYHDHCRARWSEEYQSDLLEEVFNAVDDDPRYSGVCIWQFCNSKSYINGYVLGRPCGFNDKGILDEYRRPKMAWNSVAAKLRSRENK